MIDIQDILAVMPHRYPFLLIDRILETGEGTVKAMKNITFNEPCFTGHFPERPIFPGVLLVEAMAQAGGWLMLREIEERESKLIYFTGIDKCRFRRPVIPGDTVTFEVEVLSQRRNFAKLRGRALVGDELACEAELLSAMADR